MTKLPSQFRKPILIILDIFFAYITGILYGYIFGVIGIATFILVEQLPKNIELTSSFYAFTFFLFSPMIYTSYHLAEWVIDPDARPWNINGKEVIPNISSTSPTATNPTD